MRFNRHAVIVPAVLLVAAMLGACGDDGDGDQSIDPVEIVTEGDGGGQADDSATDDSATDDAATEDATTSDDTASDDATDDADSTDDATGPAQPEAAGDVPPVLAAIALAEAEIGGIAYELDEDDGRWEIDVVVGEESTEVTVDATGTEVLGTSTDSRISDRELAALDVAVIGIGEAIGIALAEVGGEVEDVDLDYDGDRHLWEIEIDIPGSDDVTVEIDVITGEIVRIDD